LVLDEVDRMLDMGFLPDVPQDHRSLSETAANAAVLGDCSPGDRASSAAPGCCTTREKIEIGANRSPAETVTHAVTGSRTSQKFQLLAALLQRTNFDSCSSSRAPNTATADKIARRGCGPNDTRWRRFTRTAPQRDASRRWMDSSPANTR